MALVVMCAGWAGVPMAYDIETQMRGMDAHHDMGTAIKRVRCVRGTKTSVVGHYSCSIVFYRLHGL
jgi:hypothetical protein